jgi:hypothetical protein
MIQFVGTAPQKRPDRGEYAAFEDTGAKLRRWQWLNVGAPRVNGMMIPGLNRKYLTRWLGAMLGVVMVIACAATSARAEDDEEDDGVDSKLFRGLLQSLGLRGGGPNINYRERSPLVVPPNRDLPPPSSANRTVEQNPAWPNDPSVKKRKDAKAERNAQQQKYGDRVLEAIRPLRPNEMRTAGTTGSVPSRSPGNNRVIDYSAPMKPSELGYKGGLFNSLFNPKEGEYVTFTGEEPRASLIEPPTGYRTPSPTQPYGIGKERWDTGPAKDPLLPTR